MDAKQAVAEVKAARGRVWRALGVLLGARVTAGVACLLAIAFGVALMVDPMKLPPLGGNVSLVSVGLPPLQLGKEKDILQDAIAAAKRQGAEEKAASFFDNPSVALATNWIGFVLAVIVLSWGVLTQSRHWKRGIRPF